METVDSAIARLSHAVHAAGGTTKRTGPSELVLWLDEESYLVRFDAEKMQFELVGASLAVRRDLGPGDVMPGGGAFSESYGDMYMIAGSGKMLTAAVTYDPATRRWGRSPNSPATHLLCDVLVRSGWFFAADPVAARRFAFAVCVVLVAAFAVVGVVYVLVAM